ncbi:hypothetical protein BMS3Abin17_01241 [archaeon BMS3Abin17]|nr:hypothetical protein BMS3Abin17_01241 [archaeon BMS3Abin17]
MNEIISPIDTKKLIIEKQGRDGIRLEIWEKNDLGKDIKRSEIVVDFKLLKSKLKKQGNK